MKDAPCQEIVQRDGTLDELPILTCWPDDGGPYITFPSCSRRIRSPATRNIGTYRMQVFDNRTTGMHWQRHKGGAQHHRVAERLGKRLEVAVALGPDRCSRIARPRRCRKGSTSSCWPGFSRDAGSSSSNA